MAIAVSPYSIPVLVLSLKAGEDLSTYQYKFVKLSADDTVLHCDGATDKPIGILQNKPDASGKAAEVMAIGVSLLSADEALSFGNLVGTSADSQGDIKTPGTDTSEYVVGMVIHGAGAAARIATVAINCVAPHRAA